MSQINITNLTFAYEGSYDTIFTDVSFQIDTAWKLGFCGRNGRGKTTFLNLLMGKYEYNGTISANVNFEYFPFAVEDKTLSTLDILFSVAPEAQIWQIEKEISKLAVDENVLYRSFLTLSNGEQTKILLAGLFLRENNFLLIDEPTNHLDMESRQTVAKYLNGKAGFILVSHDRVFLDACVDHILSINKANIEIQQGNFSSWYYHKQLQDNFELEQDTKLRGEIKRLKESAREKAQWADRAESRKIGIDPFKVDNKFGHMPYQAAKSKKMMSRAKSIESRQQTAIEEKEKLLKNIEEAEELKIHPLQYHSSRLLSMENISIRYDREIFREVSFTLEQGDRLAIMGGNGSGKSSILKLICGEDIPHTGHVRIGSRLVVSYVPQDASFLRGELNDFITERQIDEVLFKAILRKLDFSRVQFEKSMEDYSAGQKKKVLIAASLCEHAHVYIWDEPLNYIDVLSRMQIEDLILTYNPTLLFVEHDRAFCDNVATKMLKLTK